MSEQEKSYEIDFTHQTTIDEALATLAVKKAEELQDIDGELVVDDSDPLWNAESLKILKEDADRDVTQLTVGDMQALLILQHEAEGIVNLPAAKRFLYFVGDERPLRMSFLTKSIKVGFDNRVIPEPIYGEGVVNIRYRFSKG